MTDDLQEIKHWLTEALPDINIAGLRAAGSGFTCQSYIVNEEMLIKFPHKESFASAVQKEIQALASLKGQGLKIPELISHGHLPNGLPFVCESIIPGEIIGEKGFPLLPKEEQESLLVQIGETVRQIHSVEVNNPYFPKATVENRLQFVRDNYTDLIKKELSAPENKLLLDLFAAYEGVFKDTPFVSVFSQGDIFLENIMYDRKSKTMTGLIDFGLAGYTDPYEDLYHFYPADYVFLGKASGLKMDRQGQLRVIFYCVSASMDFLNVLAAEKRNYDIYLPYFHSYLADFQKWQNENDGIIKDYARIQTATRQYE